MKGDKVMCINSDYEETGLMAEIPCEVGDICIVDEIRSYNSHQRKYIDIVLFGDWLFDSNIFCKYFITIADWREKQIKSVIDD